MKKLLLAVMLIVCTNAGIQAQTVTWSEGSKSIPPSGRTSAILKGVEIQPGLHQGIHTTHIPVYTIADIGMELSLTYHATGLRVNERTSSVGTGWNLNAGGVVARIIRGLPDDIGANGYLKLSDTEKTLLGKEASSYVNNDLDDMSNLMEKDTEPDLFYYKFGNYSGKFILKKWIPNSGFVENGSGTVYLMPKSNLRILYKVVDYKITEFIITTPDGMTYCFNTNVESANVVEPGVNETYDVAWHLSDIRTNSNTFCVFKYDSISFTEHHLTEQNAYYTNSTSSEVVNSDRWNSVTYKVPQISSIEWPSGTATFNYTTNAKLLEQIHITNSTGELNKYFYLTYLTYAQSGTSAAAETSAMCDRYKLTSFYEKQGDNKIQYTFDYESTAIPPVNSYEADYWGFYNNKSQTSFIPAMYGYDYGYELFQNAGGSSQFTMTGANRSPDYTYAKAGILTKITNPMGGVSEFEYESNQFYHNSSTENGCGLRIKSIEHYDQATPSKIATTNFTYVDSGTQLTSGKMFNPPQFAFRNHSSLHFSGLSTTEKLKRATYRSAIRMSQQHTLFQPTVFYNEVKSSTLDGSVRKTYDFPFNYAAWDSDNGSHTGLFPTGTAYTKTITKAEGSLDHYTQIDQVNYPAPIINPTYDWSLVNLLEEVVLDPTGDTVQKVSYEYHEPDHLDKFHAQFKNPSSEGTQSGVPFAKYKNYQKYYYISAWKLPKKKSTAVYDDAGNTLNSTQEYTFDSGIYRNLKRQKFTDHDGEVSSILRRYITDTEFNSILEASSGIMAIEEELRERLITNGVSFFVPLSAFTPILYSPDTQTKSWYSSQMSNSIESYDFKLIKTAVSRFMYNILIDEFSTIDEGVNEKVIAARHFVYQNEMMGLPVKKIRTSNKQVLLSSIDRSDIEIPDYNYYTNFTNYTYNETENLESTNDGSIINSFVYDDNGDLILEAANAEYNDIQSYDGTNFSTIKANNPDAFLKAYKYMDMIGVIEETDARNRKTYYVYDKYGNLTAVRDHDKNIVKANYSYLQNFTKLPDEQQHLLISDPIVGMEYINDYYTANFTYTGTLMINETITLRIQSDYKPYLTYEVDFGDGSDTTLSSRECTHSYSSAGSYNVVIQAYYQGSLVSSCTKMLKILRPLPPPF